MTGDWGGARTQLEEAGISFNFGTTNVWQRRMKGGPDTRRASAFTNSIDYELSLDLGAMKLIPGGTLYAYAETSFGAGLSLKGIVPGNFGVNYDAAADEGINGSEVWYEQSLFEETLRIRAGKQFIANDFDTNAYANNVAEQFLNFALTNNPTIPLIPQPAHGIQFVWTPCDWFYAAAGVFDGDAGYYQSGFETTYHGDTDFLSMYEIGLTPTFEGGNGPLHGSYRFGMWYDPQAKPVFLRDIGGLSRAAGLTATTSAFT